MKKFLTSLLLFMALLFFVSWLFLPRGYVLKDWNIEVPFYKILETPDKITLETTFKKVDYNSLIIPKIAGTRIQVFINNNMIYDFGSSSGNLWNKAFLVRFNKNILNENNTLKLVIEGAYDYGLRYYPYLVSENVANKYYLLIKIFNEDIYLIIIGSSLILGIILILLSYREINRKHFFFLGLSLIFVGLYLIDFHTRVSNGSLMQYFILKKILITFSFLSSLYIMQSVEFYIYSYIKDKFLIILTFLAILIIWATPNFYILKKVYDISNLIIILNLLAAVFRIHQNALNLYYFSTWFLLFTSFQSIIVVLFKINQPVIFNYGMLIVSLSYGFHLVINYRLLAEHSNKMYKKAIMDPLTNAYNRSFLEEIPHKGKLVLIDLDDLKKINDEFGHKKGDEILKEFVEIAKNNLRESDYVIRMGGDEFILIINAKNAENIIERIRNIFKNKTGYDFSYGISDFKEFYTSFEEADEKMYIMKKKKKNSNVKEG
ncbi:diguanylate cyclase (GGDEF) domain-containing protein [Marinitoga piezophila KA3]|uniref:Diguanylate cyclase (GGDEF) domain-containing protein n=1 Tax=Marinitoga piezophila (strain DSM 14283 / JCM 11233 / KA3) TaxID=443254 RepID=H2J5M5_MARPK|nr:MULTISPECIES: GGDEF domain-containing protein [Marinitoga]AEX85011.1 diguanylate cyclase (GGDEF) domain-containing protein [Marinitoga piezophila KA3]APT75515.1 hypothetical protein LN42_03230 [Marinitoga sp. 1137]